MTESEYRERRAEYYRKRAQFVALAAAVCPDCEDDTRWHKTADPYWANTSIGGEACHEIRESIAALDATYKEQTDATD